MDRHELFHDKYTNYFVFLRGKVISISKILNPQCFDDEFQHSYMYPPNYPPGNYTVQYYLQFMRHVRKLEPRISVRNLHPPLVVMVMVCASFYKLAK